MWPDWRHHEFLAETNVAPLDEGGEGAAGQEGGQAGGQGQGHRGGHHRLGCGPSVAKSNVFICFVIWNS